MAQALEQLGKDAQKLRRGVRRFLVISRQACREVRKMRTRRSRLVLRAIMFVSVRTVKLGADVRLALRCTKVEF